MPETSALDFKFGKRMNDDKSEKVCIYELGGGRTLSEMLGVAMQQRSINNTIVCITVDLSRPGNSVDSLLFWINSVKEHIQICMEPINQTNPD